MRRRACSGSRIIREKPSTFIVVLSRHTSRKWNKRLDWNRNWWWHFSVLFRFLKEVVWVFWLDDCCCCVMTLSATPFPNWYLVVPVEFNTFQSLHKKSPKSFTKQKCKSFDQIYSDDIMFASLFKETKHWRKHRTSWEPTLVENWSFWWGASALSSMTLRCRALHACMERQEKKMSKKDNVMDMIEETDLIFARRNKRQRSK